MMPSSRSRRGRTHRRAEGRTGPIGPDRRHRVLRERDTRRAARRRQAVGLVLAGVAAVVGYSATTGGPAAFGLGEPPTTVRAIAVQGTRRLSASEVAGASGIERGAALAELDTAGVASRLATHPWIAGARAIALPDGTVLIRIDERRPVAVAAAPDGTLHWLDRAGRAFAPVPEPERGVSGLPQIRGARPDEIRSGEDSPRLARGVALAELAAGRGVPGPVRVDLPGAPGADDRAGWVLRPHGLDCEAWLGAEIARFPERVGRLAQLIADDPGQASQAAQIDLRFSGRAFLRFAESGASGRTGPSPDGTDTSGGA